MVVVVVWLPGELDCVVPVTVVWVVVVVEPVDLDVSPEDVDVVVVVVVVVEVVEIGEVVESVGERHWSVLVSFRSSKAANPSP